jgi:hypothetical protein
MLILEDADFTDDELIRLNCVRCHQQVIFYSDIFDACSRASDHQYLTKQHSHEAWSWLIFPQDKPPTRDFHLWQQAIETIAPRGRPCFRLGRMVDRGHKLWEWRSDRENLYHLKGNFMDIYTPIVATGNN